MAALKNDGDCGGVEAAISDSALWAEQRASGAAATHATPMAFASRDRRDRIVHIGEAQPQFTFEAPGTLSRAMIAASVK